MCVSLLCFTASLPLQAQLKQIDKALEKGQKHLTWRSHAIDDFIRETTTLVKEAYDTLTAIKNNMNGVERVLESWATSPLMKRKSTKTYSPSEYEEEHTAHVAARYADIAEGGREIHKLLLLSNRVLKVTLTLSPDANPVRNPNPYPHPLTRPLLPYPYPTLTLTLTLAITLILTQPLPST